MDWYKEGRDSFDRYWSYKTPRIRHNVTTHLRALLKRTRTSKDQDEAERGFYSRVREINNMTMEELGETYGPQT